MYTVILWIVNVLCIRSVSNHNIFLNCFTKHVYQWWILVYRSDLVEMQIHDLAALIELYSLFHGNEWMKAQL